ncbi:uncharacterized protein [Temnothorax nylanderi]|uniref:uncharacterized protein n=1 Tax=Temnothorax nylanderi TaxID=102681 RepID=UPI003A842E4B
MNVTEKQKQMLINFMRSHPDFGRGRLRYNRENKRKLDELWEELTTILNSADSGPQKSSKEWAKTWRDWKSNLLKRVATYKSYAGGTGGGPPKTLDTSPSEDNLLEFLTPEASGMSDIPEGGAIDDSSFSFTDKIRPTLNKPQSSKKSLTQSLQTSQSLKTSNNLPTWKTSCSQEPQDAASSWQSNEIRPTLNESQSPKEFSTLESLQTWKISGSRGLQDAARSSWQSNVAGSSWQSNVEKHPHSDVINVDDLKTSGSCGLQDAARSSWQSNVARSSWQSNVEKHPHSDVINVDDLKTSGSCGLQDAARSSWQSNVEKHPHSDVIGDAENLPINNNKSFNVLASIENMETPKSKGRYSDRDTGNKKFKKQDVKHLLEQHTSDYSHIQERLLQLKEEKMAITKEDLKFKKKLTRNILNF